MWCTYVYVCACMYVYVSVCVYVCKNYSHAQCLFKNYCVYLFQPVIERNKSIERTPSVSMND